MLSWRPTWLTWNSQVPPGARAAGIAISRARRHDEDDSPAPTVRPIRQGGKRCGSPGKTPAPASPGGKAACPVVRSCRRTSREGHWLRLTVRARSASWPAAADLIATRTRWTGRKRTPVLRHLSAPDGRPIQAGVPRWSQIPRNGRRAPARPWSSGQPRRPASPPGHAGSAGSGGGLGWPGRRLKLVLAPAELVLAPAA